MPCNYADYPKNWKVIRAEILERAGFQCEWVDVLQTESFYDLRCVEHHGEKALWFKGKVVLTIAHMNHKTKDSRRSNLKALCQLHHNRYDANRRQRERRRSVRGMSGRRKDDVQ